MAIRKFKIPYVALICGLYYISIRQLWYKSPNVTRIHYCSNGVSVKRVLKQKTNILSSLTKKESIPTILEQDRKQKVGRLGNRTGRRNASSNIKNGFLVE